MSTFPLAAPNAPQSGLSIDGLETVYDQLAQAIDAATAQGKSELFLAKLALLSANALGSAEQFGQLLHSALFDL
jgi:hypothetical protein